MNETDRLGDTEADIDITADLPFEKSYRRYKMGGMTRANRAKQFAPFAALKSENDTNGDDITIMETGEQMRFDK